MTSIINIDGRRNILSISSKILNTKDCRCITKFLNNVSWDEDDFNFKRISYMLDKINPETKESIFLAIDDTVIPKSKDTKHAEALG